MTQSHSDLFAALEAERLIRELKIKRLPIDPIAIANALDILVQPMDTASGVSGMLIRLGNEFGIAFARHIDNEGFKRFSIAHELGHFRIPGHVDAVLAHGEIHESRAGFLQDDRYEREADHFAASLLMPNNLFIREMELLGNGLQAIEALALRCRTSLVAASIRYVQKAKLPVAMIISTGARIAYCFMSDPLKEFDDLQWLRKRAPVPTGSITESFNLDPENVRSARRADAEVDLRVWFGGERELPGTEEVIGLGRYGRTLSVLCSEVFADDEDEESDLEDSWNPVFRR